MTKSSANDIRRDPRCALFFEVGRPIISSRTFKAGGNNTMFVYTDIWFDHETSFLANYNPETGQITSPDPTAFPSPAAARREAKRRAALSIS